MYKYKKQISKLLIISLLLPIIYFSTPRKADAQWVVSDPAHTGVSIGNLISLIASHLKTYVLDTLATNIAKNIIKQLTAQTVNWINSGFKGNPAYVTNTGQFFTNIGDTQAAQFLTGTGLSQLCSPFQAKIRLALAKNYLQETSAQNYSCTLGKLAQNFDNFTNDFSQGGWDGWFSMTQNTQNNPYGAYMDAKNQLDISVGTTQTKYQTQLTQGNGFLSWQTCKPGSQISRVEAGSGRCTVDGLDDPSVDTKATCEFINGTWNVTQASNVDNVDASNDCADADKVVNTPGSVIANKLSGTLGTDVRQLELVQSINQIVNALITQLTQQIVGGIGKGLKGMSQSSPSNDNRALISQLAAGSPENTVENTSVEKSVLQNSQTPPSITLLGNKSVDVPVNTPFIEPGFTAADLIDGDVSGNVVATPTIDTTKPGSYTITYVVTSSSGVTSLPVTRTVNVVGTIGGTVTP